MIAKRVLLYKNGTSTNGQVLELPQTLEELLDEANLKLDTKICRIFIEDGTEVTNIAFIRDKDNLYVSDGEDFQEPPKNNKQQKECSEWVTLNVGGKYFTTSRVTLTKEPTSMLARMFAADDDGYFISPSNTDNKGAFLIDRSPVYFEPLLNFLRNNKLIFEENLNPEGILEEAKFFGLDSVASALDEMIKQQNRKDFPLTRRDVINALIINTTTTKLRFQGVNLAGANLSRLDLRHVNFKYANLQGCDLTGANLSYSCLDHANLSRAKLDRTQFFNVKCVFANMEGVSMKHSNFRDPNHRRCNLEGANLKNANLEFSDLFGANLRVAILRNAKLQKCDLRAVVFTGADLQFCDLSGSDLHEANLKGANLKFATFEFMLAPTQQSQTIN